MNPIALVQQMQADGIGLSILPPDRIKIIGEQATVTHWLPILQTRKIEIIEAMEERAAIMEYDGGMTRKDAEAAAYADCKLIWLEKNAE